LDVSPTIFEIVTFTARKWLCLPHSPLFDARAWGNPLELRDKTYAAKTSGMWLPYDENYIILTSTVFDWSTSVTDGRTDGRAITCSTLSMLHAVEQRISASSNNFTWLLCIHVHLWNITTWTMRQAVRQHSAGSQADNRERNHQTNVTRRKKKN